MSYWEIRFSSSSRVYFLGCKFDLRVSLFTQNKMLSRVNGFQESHVSGWRLGFMGEDNAFGSFVYQVTPGLSANAPEISSVL